MTPKEQFIYNTYLRISRTSRGEQWKPRKNFDDFTETKEWYYITKLGLFFNKFPQINIEDFFLAPFIIYNDEKYFDLKFYISQKAINTYALYNKQKQEESPDADNQINFLIESISFIGNYCKNNNIKLIEYINYKIGISYAFSIHYKNKNISIYSLLYFPKFEKNVYLLEPDERMIFFDSITPDFTKYKTRLFVSTKANNILKTGFSRIDNYLKNNS